MERDNMNLDDIMAEFGSNSDKPYDWAKEDQYLNSPRQEEPAAENSLVATVDDPMAIYGEAFRERARKAERTYINSSRDTAGMHKSSNTRHKTTTDAKPKDAEWKEQADTIKKVKKAVRKKAVTIGLALGLIVGGTAGVYGTIQVTDYLDNKALNETREAVVQQYTEQFYEDSISPYVTTTSTGDGLEYDEEGIAREISADGKVDDFEVYGLYSNMGEAEANRVLQSVDTATVDRPFGSVEEYMRAQGQVNASNQQDVNLWRQNVADALIAQNEIDSMFSASAEKSTTNTSHVEVVGEASSTTSYNTGRGGK